MSTKPRYVFDLANDERGSVLPLFGLMSVIAIGAVGGAVDYGRAFQLRSKMQNALDASIVSGMSVYQQTNDWAKAQAHASANFDTYFANAAHQTFDAQGNAVPVPNPGTVDRPVVTIQQQGSALTGSATMTANAPFIRVLIRDNFTIAAYSEATLSGAATATQTLNPVEVSMMVDLTGSMGQTVSGQTKIAALKAAGLSLLNILLPDTGQNDAYVRVGIAPFADYVNAGSSSLAATVTGNPTTGSYANMTNLASTRQGVYSGTYSGLIGGSSGSQSGSTPPTANSGTSVPSGGTASGGGTFSNQYCAVPTTTQTTTNTMTTSSFGTRAIGSPANSYSSYSQNGQTITVAWGAYYFSVVNYQTTTWYYISSVGSDRNGTYGILYKQGSNGSWVEQKGNYNQTQYYYNNYTPSTTTQTVTVAGCENQVVQQPQAQLISCVTERTTSTGVVNYIDDAPSSASYIGAYNHGVSNISNYSSDGKCYVAGRELAPVIPLTNNKTTLQNFFNGPSGNGPLIGGGTPGHLGTAWAWYLLSPAWNSVWNLASDLAAYNIPNTTPVNTTQKYAILMTDGEYNEQYYSNDGGQTMGSLGTGTSGEQALQQCAAMKAKGITVITIGFGYSINSGKYVNATSTDASGNTIRTSNTAGTSITIPTVPSSIASEANAAYILSQCASPAAAGKHANYYFPYSQADLADTFASIGLSTQPQPLVSKSARVTK